MKLQVVVLSDQVDSQCEKIGDLEKLLDDKKEVLRRTEDILQREMINRSALETKKLELMSDLASLKLRQAAIEKENMELRKKLAKTLHQLQIPPSSSDLQSTVSDNLTQIMQCAIFYIIIFILLLFFRTQYHLIIVFMQLYLKD